ncbi:MAG: hypothetical protein J6P09_06715 [Methanobrevibacter sp.]|nr:hypothetical protein [Methanobrevibacter sp.]
MKKIKAKKYYLILLIIIFSISISTVSAVTNSTSDNIISTHDEIELTNRETTIDTSSDLNEEMSKSNENDIIILEKGTYKLSDFEITKNLTIKGNGDPLDVVIDGEKKSSIFLIRNDTVHVSFKNITFINANTDEFGGAISIETGHAYVDNCYFINNTAGINAGGISNYGNTTHRGFLLLNNSFFMNNHAGHDGGAVTTCYADSFIYNCVFINNSAQRDGGAIRVSVSGFGNVEDCIFMFNHADEWGGAYYSWSGESDIKRCIFMNNTAGTNGGAVMISGNINLESSIITDNSGGETGGSFYIQQPMYDAKTIMNIHNNIITNNSSPYGKEIFIKWDDTKSLYTKFNANDWGDEDPNDSSVIDPDKVTERSKVTSTIKSNLFSILNVNLLDKYSDLLKDFFPDDSLKNLKDRFENPQNNNHNKNNATHTYKHETQDVETSKINEMSEEVESKDENVKTSASNSTSKLTETNMNNQVIIGNSSSHGEDKKAYELNETSGGSVAKQANLDLRYFIAIMAIVLALLIIGYKRQKKIGK